MRVSLLPSGKLSNSEAPLPRQQPHPFARVPFVPCHSDMPPVASPMPVPAAPAPPGAAPSAPANKVLLETFIMSLCPDALFCLNYLAPILKRLEPIVHLSNE
jgi:hypothetical protein